jgi:hypothetical protein
MTRGKAVPAVWLLTGLLALGLVGALARPMHVAWRCVALHTGGEQASAEVVGREPGIGVVLQLASGSQAGGTCLVEVADDRLDEFDVGEVLDVVLPLERPGTCVLLDTVEASEALLTSMSAVIVALLLGLVLVALVIQRSVTRLPTLTSRMDVTVAAVRCPRCEKPMKEGYLPLLAGLHWRDTNQPTGVPHAFGGLPGTVGWRGRPRLHAYRCEPCEIITLRYGRAPDPG